MFILAQFKNIQIHSISGFIKANFLKYIYVRIIILEGDGNQNTTLHI